MKTTHFALLSIIVLMSLPLCPAWTQNTSGEPPINSVLKDEGLSLVTGTALGLHGNSAVLGLRTFSGNQILILQCRLHTADPDAPYQVSLTQEIWGEFSVLYGYRVQYDRIRFHAAAGPAFIYVRELGAFLRSREWTTTHQAKNYWLFWPTGGTHTHTTHHRADYYDVNRVNLPGIAFDAGVSAQLSSWLTVGFTLHGAATKGANDLGFAFTVGFGNS